MNTWTVIPANRPRLGQLKRCLASIRQPVEKVVVVSNGNDQDHIYPQDVDLKATILQDPEDDINISRWWQIGMAEAISQGATEVLLLNTDALISRSGIQTLGTALYGYDVSLCGPDYRNISFRHAPGDGLDGSRALINRTRGQIPWTHRIPGFCMLLRVEDAISDYYQIYPDEDHPWWYSDDCIEWQARAARGTALVPGIEIKHPPAGGTHPAGEFLALNKLGEDAFVEEWGCGPCLPA